MQSFEAMVIVNTAPGNSWPAIVQLPIQDSVAACLVSAQMLRTCFDCICLNQLGQLNHIFKFFRNAIALAHIPLDSSITARLFLVVAHYRTLGGQFLILRKAAKL